MKFDPSNMGSFMTPVHPPFTFSQRHPFRGTEAHRANCAKVKWLRSSPAAEPQALESARWTGATGTVETPPFSFLFVSFYVVCWISSSWGWVLFLFVFISSCFFFFYIFWFWKKRGQLGDMFPRCFWVVVVFFFSFKLKGGESSKKYGVTHKKWWCFFSPFFCFSKRLKVWNMYA